MAEIIDRKSVITSFEADTKGLEKGAADSKKLVNSVQDVSAKTNTALKTASANVKQLANEQLKLGQTMQSALGPIGPVVTQIGGAFLGVISSIKKATISVRLFTAALITTGIGAIVVGLGALVAAFLSTERGGDALEKQITRVKVVFDSLLGGLQELSFKAVDFFKKLFEDPQEAIKDLGNLIKTELIERFEALKLIGPALALIFSGNLRIGFEALANAAGKVAFGVDNMTGKFQAAITTADALFEASEKLEEQEKRLALEVARLGSAYQDAREQATDIELGAVRQLEASQRARALNLQIAQKQIEVEKTKLQIQKLQNSTSDTSTKLQQQELDTQARIESLQNGARRENERFLRREAGLRKQIVDEIQKAREFELSAPESIRTDLLLTLERQVQALQGELQKSIVQGNEKAVNEAIKAIKKVEEEILAFKVSIGDKSAVEQFLEIRADRKAKIESDIQATFARISATIAAADEKRIAEAKESDDEATQERLANIAKIKAAAVGAIDSLAQLNQAQVDQLNNALQFQSERVSRFEELAKTGSARQVIIEEDRLQKLEEARAKAVEKQKRLADAQILINQAITISESVKAIATAFGTAGPLGIVAGIATSAALALSLAATASSVSGLFGSLPAFAKGTEVLNGKGTGTSDSILARLSKGERVTDAATNKKVNSVARGVFPNKLLPDAVRAYMSTPEIGAAMAGLASTTERGFRELLEEQKQTRIALQRLKVTTAVKNGEIATIVSSYNRGESWRRI
jgi:hypothetical protein